MVKWRAACVCCSLERCSYYISAPIAWDKCLDLRYNGTRFSPAPEHRSMVELHRAATGGAVVNRSRLMEVQDSPFAAAVDAARLCFLAVAALPEAPGPDAPGGFAHERFATAVRFEPAEVEQLGLAFAVADAVASRFCAAAISVRNDGTYRNPRAEVAPVALFYHDPGACPIRRGPGCSSSPGARRTHWL